MAGRIRIDPALHEEALKREGVETVVMQERPYPGYVFVAAASVTTQSALDYWIGLCLAHNATLPTAKVKKPAARGKAKG